MSSRGYGIQTLGAAAQPVYGTTLSAAFHVSPDLYTGNTDPRSQRSTVTASVTSAYWFRQNDPVLIGPASSFLLGATTPPDAGIVTKLPNYTGATIFISGLTNNHASGEFVVLNVPCAALNILAISSASGMYLGEDSSVGASSHTLIYQMLAGGSYPPPSWGQAAVGNVLETSHYWLLGTAGDTYLPMIVTV